MQNRISYHDQVIDPTDRLQIHQPECRDCHFCYAGNDKRRHASISYPATKEDILRPLGPDRRAVHPLCYGLCFHILRAVHDVLLRHDVRRWNRNHDKKCGNISGDGAKRRVGIWPGSSKHTCYHNSIRSVEHDGRVGVVTIHIGALSDGQPRCRWALGAGVLVWILHRGILLAAADDFHASDDGYESHWDADRDGVNLYELWTLAGGPELRGTVENIWVRSKLGLEWCGIVRGGGGYGWE